jgi:hypothetical protein
MNTLQEFLSLTKGTEYIIAVIFLVFFIAFLKLFKTNSSSKD